MEVFGQVCDEVNISFAEVTSFLPFIGKIIALLLSGISSSGQEEEHSFREGL